MDAGQGGQSTPQTYGQAAPGSAEPGHTWSGNAEPGSPVPGGPVPPYGHRPPPVPSTPVPEAPPWLAAVVLGAGVFTASTATLDPPGLGLVAAGTVCGLAAFVVLLVRPGVPEGGEAPVPPARAGTPAGTLHRSDVHGAADSSESTDRIRETGPAVGNGRIDLARSRAWAAVYGVMSVLLLSTALFLDASWVLAWTLPASFLLASLAFATRNPAARESAAGLRAGGFAVVRNVGAVPGFLARPVRRASANTKAAPVLATIVITAVLLLGFGTLLVLADPVFAEFASRPFRSVSWGGGSMSSIIGGLLSMLATAGAVLAARRRLPSPGRVQRKERAEPARPTWTWTVPLGAVVLLFAMFLAVQAVTLFGGDAYVQRVAGVTYAEYARQGFFQLVAVSVLVMGVVAASVRLVPKRPGRGRTLRNALLGALCLLTLVILASAMARLRLYTDTFGLTPMRVSAEAWILLSATVFALILAAGALNTLGRRAQWLPRVTVALAAAGLLAFAASDPDARIAESHQDLELDTVDTGYLRNLSADALPALLELEGVDRSCAVQSMQNQFEEPDGWASWNLSRHRAHTLLQEHGPFEVDTSEAGTGSAGYRDGCPLPLLDGGGH